MFDKHNKAISEIISQINNDELRKYLEDFNSLETTRIMDCKLKVDDTLHEMAQKFNELKADQKIFLEHKFDSSDTRLIDLLGLQVDSLKIEIQCRDLEINLLKLQIETHEKTKTISELADSLDNKVFDLQEARIAYQTTKIDKYKNGPKKKSSDSQQKWALANEFFKVEISTHRTLKAARLVAAKKAGIVAEERQLTKMMPDPR